MAFFLRDRAPGIALLTLATLGMLLAPEARAQPLPDSKTEKARRARELRMQEFEEQQQTAFGQQRMATTPCTGGFAGVYPCHDVDLLAFLPLSNMGGGSGNDIWGWTDPLDGKEYAIMGRTSGTSFVDVSDPVNPVYLGNLPPHGSNSSWRDVKVYANHAYIVSEAFGHGMQIFDLTQLRNVVSPPVTFAETAHYDDFGSAHNVAINEATGFAYAVGTGTCSGGPHFVDLQDPAAPVYAGCHIETVYTHDAQCVIYQGADPDYLGREICFNSNENTINIIDVTDKSAPVVISQLGYSGASYVHQGWLTEDHLYYLQGDEADEQNFGHNTRTRILDVADLDNPTLIANYDGPTAAIDHNLYTHQGYAFEANYRAGLRILDLGDVAAGNLTEVAWFDIYPSSDSANFNGAWSVYPYFDSGNLIVSGIEQGLFILQPLLAPDFSIDVSPKTVAVCDPGAQAATVDVKDRYGYIGDVSLSVSGLPLGAVESFSQTTVSAPGTSELTISTAGVPAGSYVFTVHSTDGTLGQDRDVTLDVVNGLPGTPGPLAPADGAIDVPTSPLLSWTAATQAGNHTIEVSSDPVFSSIVFSQTSAATTAQPIALNPLATYYWRVSAVNSCGSGSYSETYSFTTLDIAPILLVDDDDNSPDVLSYYTATLDSLGETYNIWDTGNSDAEPSAVTLAPYETVIWFTGDSFGGSAGPGGGGESALTAWLDESGCLLLASQDYFYDRGLTAFMQTHLGLQSATSDVTQATAKGDGTVFLGLGPYALSFPYSNFSDTLVSDATAEAAFLGSAGDVAIDKQTNLFATTFWSFGLEGLPSTADREEVMSHFLGWCDTLAQLDGDADGTSNGSDCAAADPETWAVPTPARDLRITTAGDLNWAAPIDPGGLSPSYDVLRSVEPGDFFNATCVESGDTDTTATDTLEPGVGSVYHYLIRVSNDCGAALGDDSTQRGGLVCP